MNEFLSQFIGGIAAIDLFEEEPHFDEDSKFVGEWLDSNLGYKSRTNQPFEMYFQYAKGQWPYVICDKNAGFCVACTGISQRMDRVKRRETLHAVRAMIETELDKLSRIDSEFDSVFE